MNRKGLWISRLLSLMVAVYGLSQCEGVNIFRAGFVYSLILLSIWFPDRLNQRTIGTFMRSNYVNVESPPILIAVLGWVLLLVAVFSQQLLLNWYRSLN